MKKKIVKKTNRIVTKTTKKNVAKIGKAKKR
jgi:hypothetical protein